MKYKRRNTKRLIRCKLCTAHRWLGNHKERRPIQVRRQVIYETLCLQ